MPTVPTVLHSARQVADAMDRGHRVVARDRRRGRTLGPVVRSWPEQGQVSVLSDIEKAFSVMDLILEVPDGAVDHQDRLLTLWLPVATLAVLIGLICLIGD